jgi:large subunit ribosomal protein L1
VQVILDKKQIEKTVNDLFADAKKRNFDESVELIITFKNLNIKNKDHRYNFSVIVPNPFLSKVRSVYFSKDKDAAVQLKGIVDKVIVEEEISKISKKDAKKLANEFDVFLAEGSVMLVVGKFLGQSLSPKGKMPQIAPLNADAVKSILKSMLSKVVLSNKKNKSSVAMQIKIGKRSQDAVKIAENTMVVYNSLIEKLPAGKQNIKSIYFKTTMSTPHKLGGEKK